MNSMRRLMILLLPQIISAVCLIGGHFEDDKNKPTDYVKMSDKITSEVITKLKKRYNIKVAGFGSGMIDCVNRVGITFQINRSLPLEKN